MSGCKLRFIFVLMLLLFQIAGGIQAASEYYVSENRSTWLQASRQCSLATPAIDFHTLSVDISTSLFRENLWVGYYLKCTAFVYVGCMTTRGYTPTLSNMTMNLGRCQSACGDVTNIGINKTACFCFNTKPSRDIHQSRCFDTCDDNITICSGIEHISLYKVVKESEIANPTEDQDLCLKYENNAEYKNFVWEKCDRYFKTICSFDNGTVGLLDDNSRPWLESVRECLRNNGLPTSLNSSKSVVHVTGPVWTGIINGLAIYKMNAGVLKSPVKGFGFLFKHLETAKLRFEWSQKELLKALCKLDMPEPQGNETSDNDRNKRIGLIVGITVPLVVVVTASVVVLVVLFRRGKVPQLCKKRGTASSEYINTNTLVADQSTSRGHINEACDQYDETVQKEHIDCSQETHKDGTGYAHDYFVLEKDITYSDESNYDSTMKEQFATGKGNVNVYNTIESGATYDLISYRRLNEEQKVNDKYDSLENAITGSSSYNITYKSDDTYNHTKGIQERKNIKTDNIYGIQIKNVGQTDTDDQDTYSHLNSNSVVKPDQIYGIPEQ